MKEKKRFPINRLAYHPVTSVHKNMCQLVRKVCVFPADAKNHVRKRWGMLTVSFLLQSGTYSKRKHPYDECLFSLIISLFFLIWGILSNPQSLWWLSNLESLWACSCSSFFCLKCLYQSATVADLEGGKRSKCPQPNRWRETPEDSLPLKKSLLLKK